MSNKQYGIMTEFGFVQGFSEYTLASGGEHILRYPTKEAAQQAAQEAGWKNFEIKEIPDHDE